MEISLYEQIYNFVVDEIQEGRLTSGDRVPSEFELSKQFGVSRITSKKALTELAKAGVIVRVRGKGSFVARDVDGEHIRRHQDQWLSQERNTQTRSGAERDRCSSLIGLVVPGFSDSYGTLLVRSIAKAVSEAGMHLVLKVTQNDLRQESNDIDAMVNIGVAGIIVFPVHGEHYNTSVLQLAFKHFPLVLVDRYLKGIDACAVYSDNVSAARMLTDHLISLGHENIGFISPPAENTSTIEDRLQGYMQAFNSSGLSIPSQSIFTGVLGAMPRTNFSEQLERDRYEIQAFLTQNPNITAFVASELHVAELCAEALSRMGKRIPEDCSLVCFDASTSRIFPTKFSHIQQNQQLMGTTAVELLVNQINNHDVPRKNLIDFKFIDFGSTMKRRQ